MRRILIRSSAFVRAARRLAKTHPHAVDSLRTALEQLEEDAFHPSLKTHKLRNYPRTPFRTPETLKSKRVVAVLG